MTKTQHLHTFVELYRVLHADVEAIAGPHQPTEPGRVLYPDPARLSQRERRNLVRATFAFIEATVYQLRIFLAEDWADGLSNAQLLALRDLQIEVSPSGVVKTRALKCGLVALIRLTVTSFANAIPEAATITCDEPGFDAVIRSVSVRDRLMHPKNSAAVVVTDSEIRNVVAAFGWVNDLGARLLTAAAAHMEIVLNQLKDRNQVELANRERLVAAFKASGFLPEQ